jgi:uncharacterized LabA/DUF88 family protein
MIRPKKGVYAFIDSQNLNLGIQKMGWKMDWKKFRQFLKNKYGVTKALMFIGYVPEFEPMYKQLHDAGYNIVLKPTFDMTKPRPEAEKNGENGNGSQNGSYQKPVKGNIDADLVLWAMKELPNYKQAVIVSGDGDFFCLVEYLAQKDRLSKLLTPNEHYSSLYNKYQNYVERLDLSRKELAYRDKFRPKHKH